MHIGSMQSDAALSRGQPDGSKGGKNGCADPLANADSQSSAKRLAAAVALLNIS
jgi:hypothetical protein